MKHNQNLVAKVFNNMRDDDRYWCKELLREGKMDERLKLLKRVHSYKRGTGLLSFLGPLGKKH